MATHNIVNSRQIFRMIRQLPVGYLESDVPARPLQKALSGTTLQQTALFFKKNRPRVRCGRRHVYPL